MKDILEWSRSFDVNARPWLMLGKGPSFSRLRDVDPGRYYTCSLNHVVRELPVDLAHIIDIDVVPQCGDVLYRNARTLVLPYKPHVRHDPSDKTIHDFVREMPVLKALADEGRLIWYNLSSSKPFGTSPKIKANFFSAEAALNILAACGVRTVRSLGVDGGNRYSSTFEDLNGKTLLANGHASFDKQFLGMAETIRRTGLFYAPLHVDAPMRVFVGTDSAQALAVKVLEYSIKKHASVSCEVVPIDDRDVPVPREPANRTRTGFSFSRFKIPSLCGYSGRGVYMDADMLVFDDLARVWTLPMDGFDLAYSEQPSDRGRVPQFSVLLLDCRALRWDVREIVAGLDEGRYGYKDLMHRFCIVPPERMRAVLPFEWNSLEHYEAGRTCLIHYTDMPTQPWVSRENKHGELWYAALREALKEGFLSREELDREIEKGHLSPDLPRWAGLPDPPRHAALRERWVPPYKRFTKNAAEAAPPPASSPAPDPVGGVRGLASRLMRLFTR